MKFLTLITMAIATLTVTEACKCKYANGGEDHSTTEICCHNVGGNYQNLDCKASSIVGKYVAFKNCCVNHGDHSDCPT